MNSYDEVYQLSRDLYNRIDSLENACDSLPEVALRVMLYHMELAWAVLDDVKAEQGEVA